MPSTSAPSTPKLGLAQSIASWRDGSAGFFAFLADVQPRVPSGTGGFVPFDPGPVERAEIAKALDRDGVSVAIYCWPRRHGKTLTSAMILVWRFVTRPAENIAVVANSERQVVDTAFRTIRQTFEHTPLLKRLVATGTVKVGADRIEMPSTGSAIQAFSSNPSALWGKKLSAAQISEIHAAKNGGDDVFEALAGSLLDTTGSLLLIDSTVAPKSSKLWELARAARNRDMWKGQCERQAKRLEAWREALMPSGETKRAYMGEFSFCFHEIDEFGDERQVRIDVPWTCIKEIMATIRERAEFEADAAVSQEQAA